MTSDMKCVFVKGLKSLAYLQFVGFLLINLQHIAQYKCVLNFDRIID